MNEVVKLSEARRRLLFRIGKRPLPACCCTFAELIEIEWPEFDNNWKRPGLQTLGLVRRRDLFVRKHWPLPVWRRDAIWTITPAGRAALSPPIETQAGTDGMGEL